MDQPPGAPLASAPGRRPPSGPRHRLRWPAVALLAAASLFSRPAAAQQPDDVAGGVVAGVVLSAGALRPLPMVQVQVEGTRLGAATDAAGRFRLLRVPGERVTLAFRRIGYQATTQQVGVGTTDVRVTLAESSVELDAVVVTGTAGGEQRRAVGNAVVNIDAVEARELSAAPDVTRLINGRAPGVTVIAGSGRVGAGPQVNIRGRSTLSLSNQPLLYIDGVRVANDIGTGPRTQGGAVASRLNDINPDDIASLEIIKGPAAATIYGTEASNGVIQIITKRGRASGGRPSIGTTVRQGTAWLMNPDGRIGSTYGRDSTGQILSWDPVAQENARGTPIWGNGYLQSYGLNVSGGTEAFQYYAGGTLDDNEGAEPTNGMRRGTANATLTLTPGAKFDVNLSGNVVRSQADLGSDYGSSVLFSTLFGSPLTASTPVRGFFFAPPEAYYSGTFDNTQDVTRVTGSVQLNHRPLGWLSQRLVVGWDNTAEDNQSLTRFMAPDVARFFTATQARGEVFSDLRTISYGTADYSATARFPIAGGISGSTSVGGQYYRRRTNIAQVTGRGFPAPGLETAAATATILGSQDYVENSTVGLFAQQQISVNDRLFVTGAVRVDNNSAFGSDFDLATYPKVSATWVASEEAFWPVRFLNPLKLRAAYGTSGQQPETFAALRTFAASTGPGDLAIVTPQFVGNSALKPERGEEVELGFEGTLFDRVSVDFTYFTKQTRDAILLRDVAPSSGFPGQQFVNAGRISNRGVELQLNARAVTRPNFAWEAGLNLGTARDRIEELGGTDFIQLSGLLGVQGHRVGRPIGAFYTKHIRSAELDASGRAVNLLCDGGEAGGGADVPCAEAPRVFHGTITPKVTGAVTNTFTLFKNFRLYGMVDFKAGHKVFDWDRHIRCAQFRVCEAVYRPERYDPKYVAQVQLGQTGDLVEDFLHDASFAKLREVSLGYVLPTRVAAAAGASRAALTLTGRNLRTWTRWTGLDPESRSLTTGLTTHSQAVIPELAQFVGTLSLTF